MRAQAKWLRRAVRSVAAAASLVRIRNAATGAAYTLLGAYLASGVAQTITAPVIRAALVILLVVAAGNAINDYLDASADAIAKPERPIPSGRISRHAAGWLTVVLSVAAVTLACSLQPLLAVLGVATVLLALSYSWILKSIPLVGNATVSLLCAATLVYGALAAGRLNAALYAAAAMTFLFVFAQEIFYTVEDEEGDRLSGVHTTATRLGVAQAVRIFQVLACLFICVSLLPWFMELAAPQYAYAVVPCTIIPTLGIMLLTSPNMSAERIRFSSWLSRAVWYSSVVPLVLLRS